MDIIETPSPNFGPRRGCDRPSLVVIHYTAMDSAAEALERLCDPGPEVSAHYLVARDGTVHRLVAEEMRAWHAGLSCWRGERDVNSHSIGIELDNPGPLEDLPPFSAAQMDALETLLRAILDRWDIPPEGVLGHSDVSVGRKIDPGPKFDWARLSRAGLAAGAKPGTAREAGYDMEMAEAAEAAFALRWGGVAST